MFLVFLCLQRTGAGVRLLSAITIWYDANCKVLASNPMLHSRTIRRDTELFVLLSCLGLFLCFLLVWPCLHQYAKVAMVWPRVLLMMKLHLLGVAHL